MANFNISYAITAANEGVYDNNPNDTGGETVFGVSRNNFPSWEGWTIVDNYAKQYGRGTSAFKQALKADAILAELVRTWYKTNFWDKFDLDKVANQSLANEIFDQAVNVGVGQATKFIQRAYNAFNHNYRFGADLIVDGKIGPQSRAAIVTLGNNPDYSEVFRKALDAQQGSFYVELGLKGNSYRTFTRGWFRTRVGDLAA